MAAFAFGPARRPGECAFLRCDVPGGPLRGGFVACFGGGPESWTRLEGLIEGLRWHRGSPMTLDAGLLKIAAFVDSEHGPTIAGADGETLLVHGADPEPVTVLQQGAMRFAALEWDGRVLRASRDPMGEVPLFFRVAEATAWFATEIQPLVAVSPTRPDLEALAAEAAFVPYTMRTAWKGVLRVPPGSTAAFDPAMNVSVAPYWRPETQLATRRCTYGEAVQMFRERFETAVARRRAPACGVLLSGGLDSAAVAVTARDERNPPRLVTVSFPQMPDTDEVAYAQAAAAAAGAPLTVVEGRTDPWDPEGEAAIFGTTSTLSPTAIYESGVNALVRDGITQVLDGHDGDGALGLNEDIHGLLLAHLDVRRLVFLARHSSVRATGVPAIRETMPPPIRRLLSRGAALQADEKLISQLKPYFRGTIGRRMAQEARWRTPRRSWRRDQLSSLTPPLTLVIEQMETETARLGADLLHPFMDRDLLSFLVSLPFSIKVDPVRSKPLMRDGLADLLPETLRRRRGKTWFNSVLERRVDPELCLRWIRESAVELPDLDYPALYRAANADLANVPLLGWIRLARAHLFAAAA